MKTSGRNVFPSKIYSQAAGRAKSETQTHAGARVRAPGAAAAVVGDLQKPSPQSSRECTRRRNPTLCWFLCMCNFEDKHRIRHRKRPLGRVYLPTRHLLMWACSIIMARRTIFLCGGSARAPPARQTHKKIKALVSRRVLLKYICTEIAFQRLIMHHAILSPRPPARPPLAQPGRCSARCV